MNLASDRRRSLLTYLLMGVLVAVVLFEALTLVSWIAIPFFPSFLNENSESVVSTLLKGETWFFLSSAVLAPVFVALLVFSWVPAVLVSASRVCNRLFSGRPHFTFKAGARKSNFDSPSAGLHSALDSIFDSVKTSSRRWILVLAMSVVLASSIAVYPYMLGLNPSGRLVGVDTNQYATWLTQMDRAGTPWNVLPYSFSTLSNITDRPLSLFMMYLGWKAFEASTGRFFQLLPALLGTLLVLATFFFMCKAGFNAWAASLTSLFSAFSLHMTVGMYGGFLSNWTGLVFFYLFSGFLFSSIRKRSWPLLAIAILLQASVLFAHAQTWWMTMGILAVFFVITFLGWLWNRRDASQISMIFTVLIVNILVNFARNWAMSASPIRSEVMSVAQQSLSLDNLQAFWQNLGRVLTMEMGISFLNPLLFFMASVGGLILAFDYRPVSRFLTASVLASAIPFIFGNTTVQTRILYNLPVHVFSFLGLVFISKAIEDLFGDHKAKMLSRLLLILAILANLNYAFRCSFVLTQTPFPH